MLLPYRAVDIEEDDYYNVLNQLPKNYKIFKELAPIGVDGRTDNVSKMSLKSFEFGDIVEITYEFLLSSNGKKGFSAIMFATEIVLLSKIGTYLRVTQEEKEELEAKSPIENMRKKSRWI